MTSWSRPADDLLRVLRDAEAKSGAAPAEFNYFHTFGGVSITHDSLGELAEPAPSAFDELVRAGQVRLLSDRSNFKRFYLAPAPHGLASGTAADPSARLAATQPPMQSPAMGGRPRIGVPGWPIVGVAGVVAAALWLVLNPTGIGDTGRRTLAALLGGLGLALVLLVAIGRLPASIRALAPVLGVAILGLAGQVHDVAVTAPATPSPQASPRPTPTRSPAVGTAPLIETVLVAEGGSRRTSDGTLLISLVNVDYVADPETVSATLRAGAIEREFLNSPVGAHLEVGAFEVTVISITPSSAEFEVARLP